ncbi:unnamed protein product [Symbiodinium pilosum]|uniref:Uncharacterized protein n=1 Tax=Symbiodinium pilosum TaxID=2952 RepID=A0A812XGE8_SYMPI|nr:unnamed protein product [Symbiodinium pilosum]
MFHHGPVRDSLAWDVIKVTIVDAPELSVYLDQNLTVSQAVVQAASGSTK